MGTGTCANVQGDAVRVRRSEQRDRLIGRLHGGGVGGGGRIVAHISDVTDTKCCWLTNRLPGGVRRHNACVKRNWC